MGFNSGLKGLMLTHFTHSRDTAAGIRIRLKAGCLKNGGSIPGKVQTV